VLMKRTDSAYVVPEAIFLAISSQRQNTPMTSDRNHVCPVELAGSLDSKIRRWLQNPYTILSPFVKEGMKALDLGCGPGFFTVAMADLVGPTGTVLAADLQQGMLDRLSGRIKGTTLDSIVKRVLCAKDNVNVSETVDFILAFFMVHEVPDQRALFNQLRGILRPGGVFLLVEPKLFHVSRSEFQATLGVAQEAGFTIASGPRLRVSRSAVLS
jgi:ubiquinone/menaquinone biosynthesis C-methylase UbiE